MVSSAVPAPASRDFLALELVECERFGIAALVATDVAAGYVTDGEEALVVQDRTPFTLQVLSCADLVTDGVSHGPGRFATAWIGLVPQPEAPLLPVGADLVARPTDRYQAALFQTDNATFQEAATGFGVPMTLADSMTFDPTAAGVQTGAVVDTQFAPPLSYRWTVDNVNRSDTAIALGHHTLVGTGLDGEPLVYYGEFEHQPGWVGNTGGLDLDAGSAFEDLLGARTAGPVNGDAVTVTMVVFGPAG